MKKNQLIKSLQIAVVACALLLFNSCNKVEEAFFRSYVTSYISLDERIVSVNTTNAERLISIEVNDGEFEWNSSGRSKEIYDSLCQKNNDMSFNKKLGYIHFPDWGGPILAENILRIDIVSENDFDETHSRGTSLNDLVMFNAFTPKPFIDNGYKKGDYFVDKDVDEYEVLTKISKLVSDLADDEGYMLNTRWGISFDFTKAPTLDKRHNLTIKFLLDNGEEFIITCAKSWE